jgi:hypothetical protein
VAIDHEGVKSLKKARQLGLDAANDLHKHGRRKARQPSSLDTLFAGG